MTIIVYSRRNSTRLKEPEGDVEMVESLRLKLKEQKGFTLIELLAVIVILGIIAAIAVPTISRVIDNSKNKAKITEAIQIIDEAKLAQAEGAPSDSTNNTITWTHTEGTSATTPLDSYISKLKDKSFSVTYNISTKKYTINGHESAPVVKDTYDDSISVTEDEFATAVR